MICDLCGKTIKKKEVRLPKRHHIRGNVWVHKTCDDKRYERYGLTPPKLTTLKDYEVQS